LQHHLPLQRLVWLRFVPVELYPRIHDRSHPVVKLAGPLRQKSKKS